MPKLLRKEDLMREIAECPLYKIKTGTKGNCETVIDFQKNKTGGWKGGYFHCAEPWFGDLEKAEVLFVSSNPSYSAEESKDMKVGVKIVKRHHPNLDSSYPGLPKLDSYVHLVDFFENEMKKRIDSVTGKPYKNTYSRYWRRICKFAAWILDYDEKEKYNEEKLSQIALTEIVHCKSTSETGVRECCDTCRDTWLDRIIDLFACNKYSNPNIRKYVVLVGKVARAQKGTIEKIVKKYPNLKIKVIETPHPSFRGLLDKARKEDIKDQIQKHTPCRF